MAQVFEDKDQKVILKFHKMNSAVIYAGAFFIFLAVLLTTIFIFNFDQTKRWLIPDTIYQNIFHSTQALDDLTTTTPLEKELVTQNRHYLNALINLSERSVLAATMIFVLNMFMLGFIVFLYGLMYLKFFKVLNKYIGGTTDG